MGKVKCGAPKRLKKARAKRSLDSRELKPFDLKPLEERVRVEVIKEAVLRLKNVDLQNKGEFEFLLPVPKPGKRVIIKSTAGHGERIERLVEVWEGKLEYEDFLKMFPDVIEVL